MIGRRNLCYNCRPHCGQMCLVRPVERPLVCSAGCQNPSPPLRRQRSHRWEASSHQIDYTLPPIPHANPCKSENLIYTWRAGGPARVHSKQAGDVLLDIHFPSITPLVANHPWPCWWCLHSFNWFSISNCHLQKSSLPARHIQSTCQLAFSIDSDRGLAGVLSKKHLRGFFRTLPFGLCDWGLKML